ncbi:MAG: transposase family protein [Myxococcales bacterium]|nr:transposase family protein [Myxococcales bacterium]
MLVSILTEQRFSAKGWRITTTTRDGGHVVVDLEPTGAGASARCSGCGETKRRIHDIKPARRWRHTDAWNTATHV